MDQETINPNFSRKEPHHLSSVEQIALYLERDLSASPDIVLPSLRELAKHYGVSRTAIAAAASLLRERGLLHYDRGRRPHRVVSDRLIPRERKTSAQQLTDTIEKAIATGTLRCGYVFTKISVLAREHRVSTATVESALKNLAKANLIHRCGRRWIVGRSGDSAQERDGFSDPGPVIVFLMDHLFAWRDYASSERTRQFCSIFSVGAHAARVQVLSVLTDYKEAPEGVLAAGPENVHRFIHRLGSRYKGTLMVLKRTDMAVIGAWGERLLPFGRPVVVFDPREITTAIPSSPGIIYCGFSEDAVARAAIGVLADRGHRCAIYPNVNPNDHVWKQYRLELLKKQGLKRGLEVLAEDVYLDSAAFGDSSPGWWTRPAGERICRALEGNPSITALIAPRDTEAFEYFRILHAAGLRIPRDLSIVSFDNRPLLQVVPVNTVDIGMDTLGYAALHLILQDIPVHLDSPGVVLNRPWVVNRGSVSVPRSHLLSLRRQ